METAVLIAEELVGTRGAACVNIIPQITSIYRWKGIIRHDDELILMIKTRKVMFDMIRDKIMTLHPYEVPEIISFDIADGSESYLKWISESTNAEK
jgi:periplasmic divalent cation tolerance protein